MEERLAEITDLLKAINTRLNIVEDQINADDNRTQETSIVTNSGEGQNRSTQANEQEIGGVSNNFNNVDQNRSTQLLDEQETGSVPNTLNNVVPVGAAAASDVQKEFESIRDSVAKITLPPWLKVHDTQTGIKQENKPALKILSKSARYTETGLKLLSTFQKSENNTFILTEEDIGALYTTLPAESYYLQSLNVWISLL